MKTQRDIDGEKIDDNLFINDYVIIRKHIVFLFDTLFSIYLPL